MNRKQAQEIRIRRAMMVIAKHATPDDWEKVVEALENEAVSLMKSKQAAPAPSQLPDWFEP